MSRPPSTPRYQQSKAYQPRHTVAVLLPSGHLQSSNFRNHWVAEYNQSNIRSLDIHYIPDQDYALVDELHPIIAILAENSDLLGSSIQDLPRVDTYWIPVDNETIDRCCEEILTATLTVPRVKFWLITKRPPHAMAGPPSLRTATPKASIACAVM